MNNVKKQDLNPIVRGDIYRRTHKASVIGILGKDAPNVVSRGSHFYNMDRWTARAFVAEMCEWASKNTDCVPTHADLKDWVNKANRVSVPRREIVIANTPDKLPLRTALGITGGAYHEALHTKYSCRRQITVDEVAPIVLPRWAKVKNWGRLTATLLKWSNLIEDTRIERNGRNEFEGIHNKLSDLQDFIIGMEKQGINDLRSHGGKPGPLSVVLRTFRDVSLGYNTEIQRAALEEYKKDNPEAYALVTNGPLTKYVRVTVALDDKDDLGCVRVAMDCIAELAKLSKEDESDIQAQQGQAGDGKTKCPQCGAPGHKLVVRPKSDGKGGKVKGVGIVTCTVCGWQQEVKIEAKKGPSGQGASDPSDTPRFEGFDPEDFDDADNPGGSQGGKPSGKSGKGGKGGKGSGGKDKQAGAEEGKDGSGSGGEEDENGDPTGKGSGKGGKKDAKDKGKGAGKDGDDADGTDGDEEGEGAGNDPDGDKDGTGGDEEGEGDGEGSKKGGKKDPEGKDGDGEGDEEGKDGDGEGDGKGDGGDEPGPFDDEERHDDSFSAGQTDETRPVGPRTPKRPGAGGHLQGPDQVSGNDWSHVAEETFKDAQRNKGSGLREANEALEESVNEVMDKENKTRTDEAAWNPWDPSLDDAMYVKPSGRGRDWDMEQADKLLSSVKEQTAYLRARLRTVIHSFEQTAVVHGVPKGRGLSGKFIVDTVACVRAREIPQKAYFRKGVKLDMTMAAAVVMDESGSMDDRLDIATQIFCSIVEPLDGLNFPTLAIGFRNGQYAPVQPSRSGDVPEEAREYHRTAGVTYDVFKNWHEKFRPIRWRFANTRADGGTPMSDGIQFALAGLGERTEAHRFLFVVTDGCPDWRHLPVIKRQCRLAKEAGIHIIGVGVGDGAQGVIQVFPDHVFSPSVSEIPKLLVAKLNELADIRSSRRGAKPAIEKMDVKDRR